MDDFWMGTKPADSTGSIIIILILLFLVITVFLFFYLEKSRGFFRKKLPGEECTTKEDCGEGLNCDQTYKICFVPETV